MSVVSGNAEVAALTRWSGVALVTGIVLATLADAVSGTLPALGRPDLAGDLAATPDEYGWLDTSYIALKIAGFLTAPWLLFRYRPINVIVASTLAMALVCGMAVWTATLLPLITLRAAQGLFCGILLVGSQAAIFWMFPRTRQPILQAIFAAGAVVAPATIAPAIQGYLVDTLSWRWAFGSSAILACMAAGLVLLSAADGPSFQRPRRFDLSGFVLVALLAVATTYLLSQGSRWDWFNETKVRWTAALVLVLFVMLTIQQWHRREKIFQTTVFRNENFAFAFVVSFVAGAALFGSAFVLPAFATGPLSLTPLATGVLLLPGSTLFLIALFSAALMAQRTNIPVLVLVPVGIILVMTGMWMLGQSASESGSGDMSTALYLRAFGLGFMFLALTLLAFGQLSGKDVAYGIAYFNAGRQIGGLIGVGGLQTLVEHRAAATLSSLGAYVHSGSIELGERLARTVGALSARGMDFATAESAARLLLGRSLAQQAAVIAFDSAFQVLAAMFVAAVPILIGVKIALSRASIPRFVN